jgi:hypothetical protein
LDAVLPDRDGVRYPYLWPRTVAPLTHQLEQRYREALGLAQISRETILQIHHFMTSLVHAASEMLAPKSEHQVIRQGKTVCPKEPNPGSKTHPSPNRRKVR